MIATTGAVLDFSTFPGMSAGNRRALASSLHRNTKRAGELFALVGPIGEIVDLSEQPSRHGSRKPRTIRAGISEQQVESGFIHPSSPSVLGFCGSSHGLSLNNSPSVWQ